MVLDPTCLDKQIIHDIYLVNEPVYHKILPKFVHGLCTVVKNSQTVSDYTGCRKTHVTDSTSSTVITKFNVDKFQMICIIRT